MNLLRDTYLTIDLTALDHNLASFRRETGNIEIMAVIKANAYGHGAVRIKAQLMKNGVTRFAVATLNEAIELREVDTCGDILILGHTPDALLPLIPELNLTQTVFTYKQAELLSQMDKNARIQIKIETGLNRIGFPVEEATIETLKRIAALPHLRIEGIYSQYAGAGIETDAIQYAKFMGFLDACKASGLQYPLRHIADSHAAIDYPDRRLDLLRPGCYLYGFNAHIRDLQPIMQFWSKVAYIHIVKAGEGVGYENETCDHDRLIATLPFGYVDGCPWSLSNHKGWVSIRGRKAEFVGLLCMDMAMVDVTDIAGIHVGDDVLVFGSDDVAMTYPECAHLTSRHRNELQSSVPARVPRVYVGG